MWVLHAPFPHDVHTDNNLQHKMEWYEKLGFVNKGKSSAQFGGGGWYEMVSYACPSWCSLTDAVQVFELKSLEARATYG
jgi:hypothetical protein